MLGYLVACSNSPSVTLLQVPDIAVIWNGEVLYCQEENPDLAYVVPKEGSEDFTDSWAIPTSAKNKENAEKWINFMLDKDVAMTNFDYLTYSIPNISVIDSVRDDAAKIDRKSTRLNSSHTVISYAVCCLKKTFFNDTATTEIYTLSLHDALPISTPRLKSDTLSFAFCLAEWTA